MNVAELGFSAATQPIKDASKDLRDLSKAAKEAAGAADKTSGSLRTAAAGATGAGSKFSATAAGLRDVRKSSLLAGTAAGSTAIDLNKVAAAASGATGQVDAHVQAWKRFNTVMTGVPPAVNKSKSALDRLGRSASDNINRMQATPGNIVAQFQDIGVTAAAGMNPMLIALQQGTQLGAAMSGGIGNLGKAFFQLLSPVNLAAIGLTAVAAILIQMLMNMERTVDATYRAEHGLKTYTTQMGYTKKEVEELNNVTVTFGDTLKAVFQVAFKRIVTAFGIDVANMRQAWNDFTSWMITTAAKAAAGIYASFTSVFRIIPRAMENAQKGIVEDPITSMINSWKDQYSSALKFFDDVAKQANANARERQDQMAAGFLGDKTGKSKKSAATPKDPWGDLLKSAQADLRALQDAGDQIGLYGQDLDMVRYKQELFAKAQEAGIKITKDDNVALNEKGLILQKLAMQMADQAQQNRVAKFTEDTTKGFEDQYRALQVARGEIGLTGAALVSYQYQQQKVNEAMALGIPITAEMVELWKQYGDELGRISGENDALNASLDRMVETMRFLKETIKGVFTEWVQNVRQGQNVFTAFANSVLNALNRIIDRALDVALNNALNGILGGQASGGIASILGFANGGTFGAANDNGITPFAKGGSFTNSIVDSPTLFKFASGTGLMGEAGPEAIMPLKRGRDGSLGVQVQGGRSAAPVSVHVQNDYHIGGVTTPAEINAAIRQSAEQTKQDVARAVPQILNDYQRNGTTG